jgi:hypothetical protein
MNRTAFGVAEFRQEDPWQRQPRVAVPAVQLSGACMNADRDELLTVCQDLNGRRPGRLVQPVAKATPGDSDLGERLAVELVGYEPLRPMSDPPGRIATQRTLGCALDLRRQVLVENVNVDRWRALGQDTKAAIGIQGPLFDRATLLPSSHCRSLAGVRTGIGRTRDRNAVIAVVS